MWLVAVLALAVAGTLHVLTGAGLLEKMELGALDRLIQWRTQWDSQPGAPPGPSAVTLVWITEADIQTHGHPIADGVLAEAVENLLAAGPRVIGLDLYRDRPAPPGSERLERLLTTRAEIVVVEKLPDQRQAGVSAPAYLSPAQVGFSDVPLDGDGVVRRMFLMMWDAEDRPYLSFSLLAALRYLAAEGITLEPAPADPSHVKLGPAPLPPLGTSFGGYVGLDAGGYQLMLDQRRRPEDLTRLPFAAVLRNEVPPDRIADRVVLVATASSSVKDSFHTPLGHAIYGGELHALAVDQLIRLARGDAVPLGAMPPGLEPLWLAFWCLAGAACGIALRSPVVLAAAGLLGLAGLAGVAYAALSAHSWVPLAAPGLGWSAALSLGVATRSRQERLEKDQMLLLFGRFVSRRIVSEIWSHRDEFMEGVRPRPQRATITALSCDLSGFAAASATLAPADVMTWIGRFMEAMAELVESHGGVVSDFTGDGLMASFGVPLVRTNRADVGADATRAVRCAVAMSRKLGELNAAWAAEGLPSARLRIGVCTGEAVVGAYGSRERLKYASVGTTVNAASRLESHDKESFYAEGTGNRILISGATWELLQQPFPARCLGAVELRGLPEETTIYRVFDNNREDHHERSPLAHDHVADVAARDRGAAGA